jgi:hypothetical protein
MNHFVSALVGGLAAGAVGLFATSSTRPPVADLERTFADPAMRATPAAYTVQQPPTAGPTTLVRCGPADAPVAVRSTGTAPVEVACGASPAGSPAAYAMLAPAPMFAPAAPTMLATSPAAMPVRTVSYDEPRPVRRAVVREVPRRSKTKTALVIGGSTAAGAGIGGLAGGKKGALIGAALGGGGAAIFEALKRK